MRSDTGPKRQELPGLLPAEEKKEELGVRTREGREKGRIQKGASFRHLLAGKQGGEIGRDWVWRALRPQGEARDKADRILEPNGRCPR